MRFNSAGPAPQARELKAALAERGVLLHIIDVSAGENIEDKVFMTMEACDALLVFGSRDYGEDTGNPASTYHEIGCTRRVLLCRTWVSTFGFKSTVLAGCHF